MFHQEFGSAAILRNYPGGRNPLDSLASGLATSSGQDIVVWVVFGALFGVGVYGLGGCYTSRVVRLFGLPADSDRPVGRSILAASVWGGLGVIVFAFLLLKDSGSVPMMAGLGVCTVLGVLAIVDWHTGYLPDELTLPLLWAGLCWSWLGFGVSPQDAVGGIIVAWGVLSLVFCGYRWVRRHEGMGRGDIKLTAALGAWTGWPMVAELLLLACVFGVVLALVRNGSRGDMGGFPFGPCLSLAGVLFLLALPT
ncbi:MAG: prepilin peptidase [Alcaligenaceae bacterium]|nr:prepilin peptidase [Alcaligenaceae bacterium]